MILADKIIDERKKLGLSQEELAEKLSVSRQAVSKWESAQSVPDLQRVLEMAELFGVSTDYLLKDELGTPATPTIEKEEKGSMRRVSLEEANEFMALSASIGKKTALGVLLCVCSPMLLILLCGFSEAGFGGISEGIAVALGLSALFLLIAAAVFLFVYYGSKTEKFNYLKREAFETAYGVRGLVKEKKDAYAATSRVLLSFGILLCILSALPLMIAGALNAAEYLIILAVCLLLALCGIGSFLIVLTSGVKSSFEILLQEGNFEKSEKEKEAKLELISSIYWGTAVAGYLGWSFLTHDWHITWVVWPVAGILCAPIMALSKLIIHKKD